jgi:hypothetical protein
MLIETVRADEGTQDAEIALACVGERAGGLILQF